MNFLKELRKNLPYLAVLFGVFALLLISCPAVSVKSEYGSATRLSGLEVAFGNLKMEVLPSAMIFTYFMLLSSIACMVLSLIFPQFKVLFSLIAGGAFFFTMILFFCSKFFLNIDSWFSASQYREMFKLGAGAVLSAIFCLFASVASIFDFVFDKAKAILQAQVNKAAQAQAAAPVAQEPAPVAEPVAEPTAEPAVEPVNEAPVEEVASSDAE